MNDVRVARFKPHFLAFGFALLLAWVLVTGGNSGFNRPVVNEVDAQEARALIDAGALVIDVRDRAASASSHLPGALLIPLEALAAHLPKIESRKADSIIVYCGDGSTLGPRAAELLYNAGFAKAVNLRPGISGWRAAGYPTSGA